MTNSYVTAVEKLGWLLDALERRLTSSADGSSVTKEMVRSSSSGRRSTLDEASVALRALSDLGVLGGPPKRILHLAKLNETAAYRAGVRAGLEARPRSGPQVRLCAALPPTMSGDTIASLRNSTEDLRGALVDLIASARKDLVLASPFWDHSTIDELAPLLARRLDSGVRLRLLGRFSEQIPPPLLELGGHPRCSLLSWFESSNKDRFGSLTFHFKAAVVDGGDRGYLGTANFTESGLRSRFEIGVTLRGDAAKQLAALVDAVLSMATGVRAPLPTRQNA